MDDDGTAQILCSTLQDNEPDVWEILQEKSLGSEDQLGHLDLSFQDVFSEGEEVDACHSAIYERSVNVRNEGVFCGSEKVSEGEEDGESEGQADESNNVQSRLIVKQVNSNSETGKTSDNGEPSKKENPMKKVNLMKTKKNSEPKPKDG